MEAANQHEAEALIDTMMAIPGLDQVDTGNVARLDECIECFHQAWGVLKVLELPGAAELAQAQAALPR